MLVDLYSALGLYVTFICKAATYMAQFTCRLPLHTFNQRVGNVLFSAGLYSPAAECHRTLASTHFPSSQK